MKEPSKFEKAREQLRILSAPYKISESYKLYGDKSLKKKSEIKGSVFWNTDVIYVPRFEYCKFRPREEKED